MARYDTSAPIPIRSISQTSWKRSSGLPCAQNPKSHPPRTGFESRSTRHQSFVFNLVETEFVRQGLSLTHSIHDEKPPFCPPLSLHFFLLLLRLFWSKPVAKEAGSSKSAAVRFASEKSARSTHSVCMGMMMKPLRRTWNTAAHWLHSQTRWRSKRGRGRVVAPMLSLVFRGGRKVQEAVHDDCC